MKRFTSALIGSLLVTAGYANDASATQALTSTPLTNEGKPLSLAHGNDPNNYGQRFSALFNDDTTNAA
jgi:hypothetical protein